MLDDDLDNVDSDYDDAEQGDTAGDGGHEEVACSH